MLSIVAVVFHIDCISYFVEFLDVILYDQSISVVFSSL